MERITYAEFEEKVLHTPQIVIADFYSDSCVPCKKIVPILAALENQYLHKVSIVKINVAYEKELTETYQITTAPTLLFFKDGKEVERLFGVKKKEELESIINAYR